MLIPRQVFAVSKLVSREPTRYAIDGVEVRRVDGQCVATALDGRRLISVKWSDEDIRSEFPPDVGDVAPLDDFQAIVSRSQWDEAGKLIPKRTRRPVLGNCLLDENSANGTVTMTATDLDQSRSVSGKSREGNFPKCQDVIPDYDVGRNAVAIGVNPRFLAEVARVVEDTAVGDATDGVRLIIPTDPRRPMVIDSEANGVQATAVLMPVKHPGVDKSDDTPIRMALTMVTLLKNIILSGGYALLRKGHADYGDLAEQRECADSIVETLEHLGEADFLEATGIVEPEGSEVSA